MRSVQFQRLKLANFGMFAGDMDMDRCWEVTSMVYTDIVVTFQRSMTFDDVMSFFGGLCVPPVVIWWADFEFGIRLPFICVEIGSLEP